MTGVDAVLLVVFAALEYDHFKTTPGAACEAEAGSADADFVRRRRCRR